MLFLLLALGLKLANLKFEPRRIKSLNVKEIITILTFKKHAGKVIGVEKSELLKIVRDYVESETEVAEILARAKIEEHKQSHARKRDDSVKQQIQNQADQVANMSPEQLRAQAQMMRSMDAASIRRMNPAMANFTDAQIQMASQQMEMMANSPEMLNGMVNQMKNMKDSELAQFRHMQSAASGSTAPGQSPTSAVTKEHMESGLQHMSNLTPAQLRQQANMMKNIDPETLRRMNPSMANWDDAQIKMAQQQMEMMSDNPDMMKTMTEQMKNVRPEDLQKMQEQATAGVTGLGDGMQHDVTQMLQNSDPTQIKDMINMMKQNPEMMKSVLRSNPSVGGNLSAEQIDKTLEMFSNMDDKNIERLLKVGNLVKGMKDYLNWKGILFIFMSIALLCGGVITYVIKSRSIESSVPNESLISQVKPVMPIIIDEDEFGEF